MVLLVFDVYNLHYVYMKNLFFTLLCLLCLIFTGNAKNASDSISVNLPMAINEPIVSDSIKSIDAAI